jgi:hypothetical protein
MRRTIGAHETDENSGAHELGVAHVTDVTHEVTEVPPPPL